PARRRKWAVPADRAAARCGARCGDRPARHFRAGDEHEAELSALSPETDRPVAGAVTRVDDAQVFEAVPALEQQRGFLGHHGGAEAPEEVEIIPIDRQFSGGYQPVQRRFEAARQSGLEAQANHFAPVHGRAGEVTHVLLRPGSSDRESNRIWPALSESKRDGQTVGDLVQLIVIEEEADA